MTDTFSATASLLGRAAQGDQRAWNDLVVQHTSLLHAVARSFRLDAADVADVVQTTWLRLLEHLDRIEDPTRLVGWLVTTARRESLRVLRRGGRERPSAEDFVLDRADDADPVDAGMLRDERDRALWEAYRALPDRCRQLLRIAVYEPRAYEEISAVLGMPVGSIGPTRRRCLTQLRALLTGSVVEDEDGGAGEEART
ncbi:MAG TPA: sigma-70 family RNA polymerase sigma factor [Mycobacteriales bacterium]|nr:sigma-70 family RNA polymerase sigma factor [Mycobacteriales bacterium]